MSPKIDDVVPCAWKFQVSVVVSHLKEAYEYRQDRNLRYNPGCCSQRSECAERSDADAGTPFPQRAHAYAGTELTKRPDADAGAEFAERPHADARSKLAVGHAAWLLVRFGGGGPDQCNWCG